MDSNVEGCHSPIDPEVTEQAEARTKIEENIEGNLHVARNTLAKSRAEIEYVSVNGIQICLIA